jgi:hypothetical protein
MISIVILLHFQPVCTGSTTNVTEGPPPQSAYRCFGGNPAQRSCVFTNVYYSLVDSKFYLHKDDPDTASVSSSEMDLTPKYTTAYLSEPPTSKVKTYSKGLTVFWDINAGSAYSFGHALIGAMFPMYVTLSNLLDGNVPLRFTLMIISNNIPAVFDHISTATHGHIHHWETVVNSEWAAGHEWLAFTALVLGDGGMSYFSSHDFEYIEHPPPPSIFNAIRWQEFRAWTMRMFGLDPNFRPMQQSVVINNKTSDSFRPNHRDRRLIHNIAEVDTFLTAQFPDAQVGSLLHLC